MALAVLMALAEGSSSTNSSSNSNNSSCSCSSSIDSSSSFILTWFKNIPDIRDIKFKIYLMYNSYYYSGRMAAPSHKMQLVCVFVFLFFSSTSNFSLVHETLVTRSIFFEFFLTYCFNGGLSA